MKKFLIISFCVLLYLISSVPVGLFLYSMKSNAGINVFKNTGFHGYVSCLKSEAQKAFDDRSGKEVDEAIKQ